VIVVKARVEALQLFLYRCFGVASDAIVLANAINSAAVLHLSVAATIRVRLMLSVAASGIRRRPHASAARGD